VARNRALERLRRGAAEAVKLREAAVLTPTDDPGWDPDDDSGIPDDRLRRADLLRRLGRRAEAAASYREALDLAATDAERRYLAGRLAETAG